MNLIRVVYTLENYISFHVKVRLLWQQYWVILKSIFLHCLFLYAFVFPFSHTYAVSSLSLSPLFLFPSPHLTIHAEIFCCFITVSLPKRDDWKKFRDDLRLNTKWIYFFFCGWQENENENRKPCRHNDLFLLDSLNFYLKQTTLMIKL